MRNFARALFGLVLVIAGGCGGDGSPSEADGAPELDASRADASRADAGSVDAGVTCVPRTCEDSFALCGETDDGCGESLSCGECAAPLACGARQPNVCGVVAESRVCNPAGWCWEHPLPFGMNFRAIWGASADDIWVAGDGGTLLRGGGASWQARASGTDEHIQAIWGAAADDVWIGGIDYLRRSNGDGLVAPPGGPADLFIGDIHGSAANDVWVVGRIGSDHDLYRFDGTSWTGYENPKFFGLSGVWAASPVAAWAVGFSDTQLLWNGSAWSPIDGIPQTNSDVWGTGASDVWVAGSGGVHRWDGEAWTTTLDTYYLNAIDGTRATDVWAGGESGLHHYDGAQWSSYDTDAFVQGLWAGAPAQVYAAGLSGRIWSWDGSSWTKRTGFGVAYRLEDIVEVDGDVWLVGSGAMRWRDGVLEDHGPLFTINWYHGAGVWGASGDDLWAVGPSGQFAHWDGSGWSVTEPIGGLPDINAIWGAGPDDIYAVTDAVDPFNPSEAYVVHWDGTSWSVARAIVDGEGGESGRDLHAVSGTGPDDVWVAGEDGAVWHFDGGDWSRVPMPLATAINDIWASPSGTIWLATTAGVYRRAGDGWAEVGGLGRAAGTLTGTSNQDVWVAIGDRLNPTPLIAHWNGVEWAVENTGAGQEIRRLAVTDDSVFAAGRSGAILRKAR